MASRGTSNVAELVKAVGKHKKFRQLASYSVQCLEKVITPPHVGWERNLKDAFDAGAADKIFDVLKIHSKDDTVISSSTAILGSLASNSKFAPTLIERGIVEVMAQTIRDKPESPLVPKMLELIENAASSSPDKLLESGGLAEVAETLRTVGRSNPAIASKMIKSLEKLSRAEGAAAAMVDAGAIDDMLNLFTGNELAGEPEATESMLRCIDRLSRDEKAASHIRDDCNGMQKMADAIDMHRASDRVAKLGARALGKLASSNIEDLIQQMDDPRSSDKQKQFVSTLIANLATEEENVEKIIQSGGLTTLVRVLGSSNPKSVAAAARAVGRIAESDPLQVSQSSILEELTRAYRQHAKQAAVTAAVVETFNKFIKASEDFASVHRQGIMPRVVGTLRDEPDFADHLSAALQLLETAALEGYNLHSLLSDGIVEAIGVAMMITETADEVVQLNGCRCLIYLASSRDIVLQIADQEGLPEHVVDLATNSSGQGSNTLVMTALYLIASICTDPAISDKVKGSGAIKKLLPVVATHSGDSDMRDVCVDLIKSVNAASEVDRLLDELPALLEQAQKVKTAKVAQALAANVQSLNALAVVEENAATIASTENLEKLSHSITSLAKASGLKGQESALASLSGLVGSIYHTLASAGGEGAEASAFELMKSANLPEAVVTATKLHPKLVSLVTTSLDLVNAFAQTDAAAITEIGGIEACVAAIRSNPSSVTLAELASNALLQIASTPAGAVAVAKNGGSRQIVQTIASAHDSAEMARPVEKMLAVLNQVAVTSEGADILRKQDAVATVMDVASSMTNSAIARQATQTCLDRLLQTSDAVKAVENLESATSGKRLSLETLRPVLQRIGNMATISETAQTVRSSGGEAKVLALCDTVFGEMAKAETVPDSESEAHRQRREKRAGEIRELLPQALGTVAKLAHAGGAEFVLTDSTIAHVSTALDHGVAIRESMDVIKAASANESTANHLIAASGGKIVSDVTGILRAEVEPQVMSDAFDALAKLASYSTTVSAVADSGIDSLVTQWLDANVDDADPQTTTSAMTVLSSVSAKAEVASSVVERGGLDVIKSVMAQFCSGVSDANPGVLASSAEVVKQLAKSNVGAVRDSGIVRRVFRGIISSNEYLTDETCAASVLDMITDCCSIDAVMANAIGEGGAQDIVMAIMSANGSNAVVLESAAKALRAIGTSVDVSVLTKEVEATSEALASAERFGQDTVQAVVQSVKKLGNFMMMDGMVTPENAGPMLAHVSEAVGLIAESELAPPDDIAYGLSCVARLAAQAPSGAVDMQNAIEVVLDILDMYGDNTVVIRSAVDCFGILTDDPKAVDAMIALGALSEITKLGAKHAGDLQLQANIKSAVASISAQAATSASSITSSGKQGEEFMRQLLDASIGNKPATEELLSNVASSENGTSSLWSLLDHYEAGNIVIGEAASSLHMSSAGSAVLATLSKSLEAAMRTGKAVKVTASDTRGQVLGTILQSAINLRAEIEEDTPEAEQLNALERYRQAMITLSGVAFANDGAAAFAKNKGVENLMQLLEVDIETMKPYVPMIAAAIAQVVNKSPPGVIDSLANQSDMELFARATVELADDQNVAMAILSVMSTVVKTKGAKDAGITREIHEFLNTTFASRWAGDAGMTALNRQLLDLLEARFSTSQQAAIRSSVASALIAIKDASSTSVRKEADQLVYVDTFTGGTADGAHFEAMKTRLAEVASVMEAQSADNMVEVDENGIKSMVNALKNNPHVAEVAKNAAKVLCALSANQSNCENIAAADGIAALLASYRHDPTNEGLVISLVTLLARIARNDAFKPSILDAGGVEMLNEINSSTSFAEDTQRRSLGALADLAHENEVAIARIMATKGVKGAENAMQRFPKSPRLLENAMTLLSNLTHGSEENMLEIGQTCGDEITKVVWDFARDQELVKMALRALGNLANMDENVAFVVQEHNAVDNIKRAIKTHPDNEELVSIALEVLGNFAAAEVQGDEAEGESIRMHMHTDAATDAIVEAMTKNPFSASIQTAAMFALSELIADPVVRSECDIDKVVIATLTALKTHDWDGDLIRHASELIREFPAKGGMDRFVQSSGMRFLLQAIENHGSNDAVTISIAKTIAMMCAFQRDVPDIHLNFMSLDAPTVVLGVAQTMIDHAPVAAAMFEALAGMSVVEEAATSIAEVGMHTIVTGITKHMHNPDVLVHVLRLMDLISLNKENINEVVNAGGINALFDVCVEHGPDEDSSKLPSMDSLGVIKQAVATLSTISSASTDFASLMMEEGLDEVLANFITTFDARTETEKEMQRKRLEGEEEGDEDEDDVDVPEDDPILAVLTNPKMRPEELRDVLRITNYSPRIAALLEELARDELEKVVQRLEQKRSEVERLKAKDLPSYEAAMKKLDAETDRWAEADDELELFVTRAETLDALTRECNGAANMMGALDGINKSAALQAKAARSAALAGRDEVAKDELASIKNSVCVAKLMNIWSKGRPTTFQLLLSDDLENIVWQDASTNAKRGNVPVSTIAKVVDGADPVHQRGRGIDPKRCFYICNPAGTVLALEPVNPRTKTQWLTKLKALFEYRDSAVEFTTAEAEAEVAKQLKGGAGKKTK